MNNIKLNEISNFSVLTEAINKRKAFLTSKVRQKSIPVIDAFHGEMRFMMHPNVQTKILEFTQQLFSGEAYLHEINGNLYSKSQPKILRKLAIEKLFSRMGKRGLDISIDEVLVCPYSSLMMLEVAVASIARPNGIILCPEGFYKSNAHHVEKFGLKIKIFPIDFKNDAKIDPESLQEAIEQYRDNLCGLLLTIPGNPLTTDYTEAELIEIGKILVKEKIKTIVDASFEWVKPDYLPLGAINVVLNGNSYQLFEQTVTITGLSKGHHAMGPFKIGAAASGDRAWLAKMKHLLTIPFQRETTGMARIVLEETPQSYLYENQIAMMNAQKQAKLHCQRINEKFGFPALSYLGTSKYGPFMVLTLNNDLLSMADIKDGWQLADMLLATVSLNVVAGVRMGLSRPAVRINIDAPRINGKKKPEVIDNVFQRIELFVRMLVEQKLTYTDALVQLGVNQPIGISQK